VCTRAAPSGSTCPLTVICTPSLIGSCPSLVEHPV